ncbi:MAG: DUF1440 domain-containing protein [Pyrinomonadaceae bacterium]
MARLSLCNLVGGRLSPAMGATSGAIYGVTAELVPVVTVGAGIPFGAAVWLIADDAAVPALGLSKSPTEYPLSTHAYALASHFVYGLTTDIAPVDAGEASFYISEQAEGAALRLL